MKRTYFQQSQDSTLIRKQQAKVSPLLITMSAIVIFLAVVLFYQYSLNLTLQNQISDLSLQITKLKTTPIPTQKSKYDTSINSPEKTIFMDNRFPFTFEYPGSWEKKEEEIVWFAPKITVINLGLMTVGENFALPPNSSAMPYKLIRQQNLTISGVSAKKTIFNPIHPGDNTTIFMEFNKDNRQFGIKYNTSAEKLAADETIIDQILSSLIFMDPISDSSGEMRHYINHNIGFTLDYPEFLVRREIDHPYGKTDKMEKLILFCESGFETSREQGSPHCINGGGFRVWYNPDAGWYSPCPDNSGYVNFLGKDREACSYPSGVSLYIGLPDIKQNQFMIDATYSDKFKKELSDFVLKSFKFTR